MNTGENMKKRWVTLRMMPWPQKRGLAPLCCGRVQDESGGGEWPGCLGVLIKSAAIPNFSPVHNLINSDWNVPVPVLPLVLAPHISRLGSLLQKLELKSPASRKFLDYSNVPQLHTFTFMSCSASCTLWILGNCNEGLISAPCAHSQTVHSEIFTLHNPHIRPQLSRARVWTSRDEIS